MGDPTIATDFHEGIADLVAELGKTATIRRDEGTVFVDEEKKHLGVVPDIQDYAVEVLIEEYTHKEIDGTTIRAGDKKGMVSLQGIAITPETTDQFFDVHPVPDPPMGKWEIVSVKLPEVAGVALFAAVQLRQ